MTHEERLAKLETRHEEQAKDIKEIREDVKSLVAMANRWKGAFFVILAIGGVVGWLADKALSFFHK